MCVCVCWGGGGQGAPGGLEPNRSCFPSPRVLLAVKRHALPDCRLGVDNAWHPAMEEDMAKWSDFEKGLYRWVLGTPLKFWASVGHQIIYHFDLDKYTEKQKPRVSG